MPLASAPPCRFPQMSKPRAITGDARSFAQLGTASPRISRSSRCSAVTMGGSWLTQFLPKFLRVRPNASPLVRIMAYVYRLECASARKTTTARCVSRKSRFVRPFPKLLRTQKSPAAISEFWDAFEDQSHNYPSSFQCVQRSVHAGFPVSGWQWHN